MRSLVYIPIIHTELELGSLAGPCREAFVARHGAPAWDDHVQAIRALWDGIERRVRELGLQPSDLRIYQDGLPVCGKEEAILRDIARQGSPNHRLVARLVDEGAHLVGTEDPKLLLEEYRRIKGLVEGKLEATDRAAVEAAAAELLTARDVYIAARIDATLPEAGTGLLFIGMAHHVHHHLPHSIQVTFLIHRLPFDRGFEPSSAS